MRFKTMVLATAAFAVLLAPIAQADDSTNARLQALRDRLASLEQKLETRETTAEAQRELIEQGHTGQVPDVSQGGSLDGFFSSLEVGGHVTGSYTYAFENPSQTSGLAVASQPLCQFNCNHNTFEFDAAKLEIGKSTQGRGTAGFQLDLLFGANNQILGGRPGAASANDNDVFVQEAYAVYNWNDVDLRFGKFETLLGYEVLDSPYNPNISHGVLFTFAIPLFHTGFLASGNLTEQVGWAAGITNGFNNATDNNHNKGLLGQLSYSDGPMFGSVQTFWGAGLARAQNAGNAGVVPAGSLNVTTQRQTDDALIVDFVGTYDPSETLHFWLNADWAEQEDVTRTAGATPTFDDVNWWGVALGSKMTLNEKLSLAVRGEYFEDEKGFRIIGNPPPALLFGGLEDLQVYTLTGTLAYALTENLTTRAELRYDRLDARQNLASLIPSGTCTAGGGCAGGPFEESGVTGYLEVSYSFD